MKAALSRATATKLTQLRARIGRVFRLDTAAPGTAWSVPSAGHCAAVAAIVNAEFGGELVSSIVEGQSHWFNRLNLGKHAFDVDLTGDQFGYAPLRVVTAEELFPAAQRRSTDELNDETLRRALLLAKRAGLDAAARKLARSAAARELIAA